jgi:hypothetical protein
MKLILTTSLALASLSFTISAQDLPRPNQYGDYTRTSHTNWVVVDRDPRGLNCRLHEDFPTDWFAPHAIYPRMNVWTWNIVDRFVKGTHLLANISPAGFATMGDERNKPWLKVSIGDNEEICFVRANSTFIKPVAHH